jgi:hypothetical protein
MLHLEDLVHFTRVAGLLQDRIIAAEVVLANGTLANESPNKHADLF